MKEQEYTKQHNDRHTHFHDFFNTVPVPQNAIDHFTSIPWTNALLTQPNYELKPFFARHTKPTNDDMAISRTLNTPTAFAHWIHLFRKDLVPLEPGQKLPSTTVPPGRYAKMQQPPDVIFLISIGGTDLNGHSKFLQGGFVSLILDNCMLAVISAHCLRMGEKAFEGLTFTAGLNVMYVAPVVAPGDVVVNCWLVERTRNKWVVRGQIVDGKGRVLAQGDSVWLVVPEGKL